MRTTLVHISGGVVFCQRFEGGISEKISIAGLKLQTPAVKSNEK